MTGLVLFSAHELHIIYTGQEHFLKGILQFVRPKEHKGRNEADKRGLNFHFFKKVQEMCS